MKSEENMNVLGVRCSNKDFAYAILTGKQETPVLIEQKELAFPKSFDRAQSLAWLLQEIEEICLSHRIVSVVLRASEGRSRDKAYEARVEHEAAVQIACCRKGVQDISKKIRSTIAKDLGQKGSAKSLASLDISAFPDFLARSEKGRDAILAGWSALK